MRNLTPPEQRHAELTLRSLHEQLYDQVNELGGTIASRNLAHVSGSAEKTLAEGEQVWRIISAIAKLNLAIDVELAVAHLPRNFTNEQLQASLPKAAFSWEVFLKTVL